LKTLGSEDDILRIGTLTSRLPQLEEEMLFYLQKMQLELFLSIDLLQLLQSDSFDPQTLE
jgi:hypothetical protein